MPSDPQAISRAYLRPIRSRPLARGQIDLAGVGFRPDVRGDERWPPRQAFAFMVAAASTLWGLAYLFALGLIALATWGLMLAPIVGGPV
ncbi:hypothetical protein [Phenylobacterium sp.]|jgi:hypothetical protein|uniref:hypothetical protein n=1 Tax=Phenylobacterium sp. TaxID=1871053 RepID=UPI002F413DA1